ncbi:MAG: salicylate synthase [Azospirillaceae bacterium]|nr:salicylate synthase [Azospirillaceae bacterium]
MAVNSFGATQARARHVVPLEVDIITAAGALAATMQENPPAAPDAASMPYVLYEKDGEILFAAGEAVVLTLDQTGLHLRTSRGTRTEPLGDRPLKQIQAALAGLAEADGLPDPQWRAYGWAAFEFSCLLHGLPIPKDAGTLLHLSVPRHEVHLQSGQAEMRVADPALATLWEQALRDARPEERPERVLVDEVSDTSGYLAAAADTIRVIDGTRLRKVILSRSVPVAGEVDLVGSYQALRRNNTPARSFLLRLGGIAAAGVSPQAIIEVSPAGAIATQPLAGTRALTGQPATDATLRDELLADPKEIYEHALSVKLAQDEIASVSADGSVVVEDFMHVVARGSVQHMASYVRGRLRPDASCWDAFGSVFPAVTASGIPKRQACVEIVRREQSPRGLYSGAVLTVDHQDALDAALVLRSVYQRAGATWLRAGAGLISQSNAERELEETREKLRSVSRFLVPRLRKPA